MKRPGRKIKASKISDIVDEVKEVDTRQQVYNIVRDNSPIGMMKIASMTNVRPRTVRNYLAELVFENKIEKAECTQCGTHTAYKIS